VENCRNKVGYTGFVATNPPRYYLSQEVTNLYWVDIDGPYGFERATNTWVVADTVAKASGLHAGHASWYVDAQYQDPYWGAWGWHADGSNAWNTNRYTGREGTNTWATCTNWTAIYKPGEFTTPDPLGMPVLYEVAREERYYLARGYPEDAYGVYLCHGLYEVVRQNGADEYTTTALVQRTYAELFDAGWSNAPWGFQATYDRVTPGPSVLDPLDSISECTVCGNPLSTCMHRQDINIATQTVSAESAKRSLATTEDFLQLRRMQFRVCVTNAQSNVVYRFQAPLMFFPEGTNAARLWTNIDVAAKCEEAGMLWIRPHGILIDPPPENGEICVLKVEFLPRAGKINYGFDPKETVRDDGPYPWTSVDKDDTADLPKIVIDSGAVANRVELVVVSGGSSADIDPKTLAVSSTDLTITGQGTFGNALVEARIGSIGPACSKLNIMALPKRGPVQVGIYRISDSSSAGTAFPAGVPSDAEIINTLNDIFEQAHVEFELHTSSGVYDVQYDTTKLPYVSGYPGFTAGQDGKWEEGEQDAFFTGNPLPWAATIKVFLLKENGDTKWNHYAEPYDAYLVRGFTGSYGVSNTTYSVVFTEGTVGHTALTIAHEVGHRLGLAAHDDGGGHDAGPWPSGEESLMRSGQPTGAPSAPTFPVPGRWLRHEDWKKANDRAGSP
jgi:hypothetical protein